MESPADAASPSAWLSGSAKLLLPPPANGIAAEDEGPAPTPISEEAAAPSIAQPLLLFDVSDLVYYIGHHPNLSGIQRVQASILLGLMKGALYPPSRFRLLSYDTRKHRWLSLDLDYMRGLLQGMFLPQEQRRAKFDIADARDGILPEAAPLGQLSSLDTKAPSVLCLLGAAWVRTDYFREVLELKRKYGTRFVMCLHDLIPIFARETCDQGTAKVFDEFIRRALRHTDCFLAVSENTAADLRRYAASLRLAEPNVVVTGNGSSFGEFMPSIAPPKSFVDQLPRRFVLFVSTIEGRKNHRLMFEIWRDLKREGVDVPYLVCVGRLGWKSEAFLSELVESDYLAGKIILLQDISDAELSALYERCLFTVFPSLYEGWGLPVSESLAAGKVCVVSDRASLPQVGGDLGLYIDPANQAASKQIVRRTIEDESFRSELEQRIRHEYHSVSWTEVAGRVIDACALTVTREWQHPYPYPTIDFGTEIGFARLERNMDGVFGDRLLDQVARARNGILLSQPLAEAAFLRGEEARFGPGWAQPEDWGCWMRYPGAELAFHLPPTDDDICFLFLVLRTSNPVRDETLDIIANNETVWNGRIGDVRTVCCRIRSKPGIGPWKLALKFQLPYKPEVYDQITAMDSRRPAIGIDRMVIVSRSDLLTRLDLLQNTLFRA